MVSICTAFTMEMIKAIRATIPIMISQTSIADSFLCSLGPTGPGPGIGPPGMGDAGPGEKVDCWG